MSVRNLDRLFNPRSVALFGAAERRGSVAAVVLRNLRRTGFPGALMLVGGQQEAVDGVPVYRDLASLPQIPDLAVIASPPETIPGLAASLAERGTKAAILLATGPGEQGIDGHAWRQATLAAARPYLLRLVGPNGIGVIVPRHGLDESLSHVAPPPGDIAFVSQSGAMITAMLDWAAPRGIGFSHVVSLGDMADVDFGDMLDYLAADADTRAILLYVEGITHGRKFMSAARAAARGKPVLVLQAGRSRSGARIAAARTGITVGSEAACDAAFRRAGMLRVGGMAELFDAAETLALTGTQAGDGLAILTNGGGAGLLAADALEARGGRLAPLSAATLARLDRVLPPGSMRDNPVDIRGDAPPERYAAALEALLADRGIDGILILNCPNALSEPDAAARAVVAALAAASPDARRGRNIFTAWLGEAAATAARRRFAAARLASYETPDAAVAGFFHRVEYQRNQALLMETPPLRLDPFKPDAVRVADIVANAIGGGRAWLDDAEAAMVLAAYGIPYAQPAARPGAVELRVGLSEDPVFGPVILFGQGGVAAEIVADSAAGLPPLNLLLARGQMARTRVWRLLQADHGRPAAAIDAAADVLIRVGQLAAEHAEIRELDINPLLADAAGVVALAARIRVAAASTPAAARLAIAPYPRHLETVAPSRDGTLVRLRPARPEDEPLLQDLAAHMSAEDLRLRFFTPVRGLTHAVAARLTQIDYDREMALLAQHGGQALGIAHFFADPDRIAAEYAIAVRSDWQGRGIGYLLMTRLIDIARECGIAELVGEVLRENQPMLEMCRALGFTIAPDADDPAILRVRRPLAVAQAVPGITGNSV
jgi:acetyltransferase